MTEYQVLARKYRPQKFQEVLGQEPTVTTLKNAIKFQRLAYAYLFSGSRGTGKTTLARIFAKALNCQQLSADQEPCNQCTSCREIAAGRSLDVLEIDGASHRGIDDIRQINETAAYASATGNYKIYIIDEVHMLTKEAFNALLKILEEPPPKVKFLFATTEPHKVLPTILSRCQRFSLQRIAPEVILKKLQMITANLQVSAHEEALRMIANRAEGGLRDAESLLDQVLAFHDGTITAETVASLLGILPNALFFELDRAGKEGNLAKAFDLAATVFTQGKDLLHFYDSLIEHFRTLLLVKLMGKQATSLSLSPGERTHYEASAKLYSQEQCVTILDFLIESQQQIRFSSSPRIMLENLLLRIIRVHQRVPIDILIKRLADLEQKLLLQGISPSPLPLAAQNPAKPSPPTPAPLPPPPVTMTPKPVPQPTPPPAKVKAAVSNTVDPTPQAHEVETLPFKKRTPEESAKLQSRYDTLLHFAAVELEGTIQKKFT